MPLPPLPAIEADGRLVLVAGLAAAVPLMRWSNVLAFGANAPVSSPHPGQEAHRGPSVQGHRRSGRSRAFCRRHRGGVVNEAVSAAGRDRRVGRGGRAGGRKESLAAISRDLGTPLLDFGNGAERRRRHPRHGRPRGTEAGQRVFAQDFSGLPADLLTLEDQIYSRLHFRPGAGPTSEELARALSHPTENIEAYQLYLRGRNAMRGQQDVKNVQAAIGFYEEALKQDAGFARAYAGISDGALLIYRTTKEPSWAERRCRRTAGAAARREAARGAPGARQRLSGDREDDRGDRRADGGLGAGAWLR